MMNNNKILTVSYGTFSCTLEGFEDSFGTMKAIAEYFRDLAADDRYFGAEPPQPDAEMLARIAQKEISRRVEARQHDGRIVLSARQDTAPMAEASPAAPIAAASHVVAHAAAPAPADALDFSEWNAEAFIPEAEDDVAEPVAAPLAQTEAETDIVPSLPDDEVEAFFAEADTTAEEDYDNIAEEIAPPASMEMPLADDIPEAAPRRADSIADKLARIREVVSQHHDAAEDPDYTEDEHALAETAEDAPALMADMAMAEDEDEDEDEASDLMSDALRDISEALEADDAADRFAAEAEDDEDLAAHADEAYEDEDDVSDILYRLDQADRADIDDTDDDAGEDSIFGDVLSRDALEDALAEDEDEDDAAENFFEDESPVAAQADDATQAEEPPVAAPRARVIKVRRVELEAAITRGDLEEYDDEDEDDGSSLSAQDEAELARELAEVEAEIDGTLMESDADDAEDLSDADAIARELAESDEEDAEEAMDIPVEEPAPARSMLPSIDEESSDVSRLMAESDSQMGDEESATRRDAFAHLRAAVAAKKADAAAGDTLKDDDEDGAYRDDLASVVRPRRPASVVRSARPNAENRPAPLKLVAEQRIDVEQHRSKGPVMPRRVAAVADVAPAGDGSENFAEFAADMGASSLPDLLEAAAAYLSFVEGRAQFSRPQLMTKVRQVEKDDFSREDGLRSFGKLLRDGKIEKIKGGRFQVSDQIGFKPDHRAAG